LREWIKAGGTWIAGPFSDVRKTDATKFMHAPFGSLEEWTGACCKYELPGLPRDFDLTWKGGHRTAGALWYNAFEPRGGEALATYAEGPGKGLAAVVRKKVGRGAIILLGTLPPPAELLGLVNAAAVQAGLDRRVSTSPNLVAVRREGPAGNGLIVVENANRPGSLRTAKPMQNLLNGKTVKAGRVPVRPFEVLVLREA
jgi:beta-galactosidase